MSDPETSPEEATPAKGTRSPEPDEPGLTATLGERLEAAHQRFRARIEELKREGAIE